MSKLEHDGFLEVIENHVMDDGGISHHKGMVIPYIGKGKHIHIFSMSNCDISHCYNRDDYSFNECFREFDPKMYGKEPKPPRVKKTLEEYCVINSKLKSRYSITFFDDKSGHVNQLGSCKKEFDFYSFEELDEKLEKLAL